MEKMFYQNLIANMNVGYIYLKSIFNDNKEVIDYTIVEANPAFINFFHLDETNVINQTLSTLLPDHEWVKSIGDGNSFVSYSSSNNCFYHFAVSTPSPDNYAIFVFMLSEIDQYMQKEQRFLTIFDSILDIIWTFNLNGEVTYVNKSIEDVLGYQVNDLMGKSPDFMMTSESQTKFNSLFNELINLKNTTQTYYIELTFIKKTGRRIVFSNSFHYIINKEQPDAIVVVSHDVSHEKLINKKMIEREESLRLLLNSTAEGIYGVDIHGNCTFINSSALKMLGYSEKEVIGKNTHQLFTHHLANGNPYLEQDCTIINAIKSGTGSSSSSNIFWRKDGTYFHAQYNSYPQLVDNKLVGLVVIFHDITNQYKMMQQLKEAERSKAVLLENIQGIAYRCLYDEYWTMLFLSQGCYELTGYKAENLINNRDVSFNDLILPEYQETLRIKWGEAIKNKSYIQEEYQILTAQGEKKWVLEKGQPVFDDLGKVIALEGIIIDITPQKLKQEEIAFLSYHDTLTGALNRLSFEMETKRLDHYENLPLSIIIGDINGLKLVNDAFGMAKGDEVVIDTANLLKDACRPNDLLFRIGGDEFAILMPNTDENAAIACFETITAKIAEYNRTVNNETMKVNISLGFATKNHSDEDFANTIKIAEDYMNKRKLFENKSSHSSILASIRTAMNERCEETEQHAERLQLLTRELGASLSLSQYELDELALLAALHDIGKVGIDDKILKNPGKLTTEEWENMKKHPAIGYRIAMSSPELVSIAEYILTHHERWDGKGYPQGLKGKEIPLLSRILAVADAYDAMTENRVYHKGMSKEEALKEIMVNAGTQFDPTIALTFVRLMKKSLIRGQNEEN